MRRQAKSLESDAKDGIAKITRMSINYQSIGRKKKHEFHVIDFNEENNDVTSSVNLEEQSTTVFHSACSSKADHNYSASYVFSFRNDKRVLIIPLCKLV